MNIIICDDDANTVIDLYNTCQEYGDKVNKIYCYNNPVKLKEELINNPKKVDLFILDIEMPEVDGFELKQIISQIYIDTSIIFITSHLEMMEQAFGKKVIGFIKKGQQKEQLPRYLDEVKKELEQDAEVMIEDGKGGQRICKSKIITITSKHIYSNVNLLQAIVSNQEKSQYVINEKEFRISLDNWMEKLGTDNFCRVNRSCIVNMKFITRIKDDVELETGDTIMIPAKKLTYVKKEYNRYCRENTRYIL